MSRKDPEPFDRLHDGEIVAIERDADMATLVIEAGYLRARLPGQRGAFRLRLVGVRALRYFPYGNAPGEEDPPIDDPAAIAAAKPNINQSKEEPDGTLSIYCGLGRLHVDYDAYELSLEDGTPLGIEDLRAASKAYWDDWREKNAKK